MMKLNKLNNYLTEEEKAEIKAEVMREEAEDLMKDKAYEDWVDIENEEYNAYLDFLDSLDEEMEK